MAELGLPLAIMGFLLALMVGLVFVFRSWINRRDQMQHQAEAAQGEPSGGA